jgi:hypothetical protein
MLFKLLFKQRKRKPAVKEIRENHLVISLKNGESISLYESPYTGKGKIYPWKEFYKWYFGRTSDSYILPYKNGEVMVKRDTITSFKVYIDTNHILVETRKS